MIDQPREDIGKRATRFARGHHVDVERGKDAWKIAQRLRETAPIDQRPVQRLCHLVDARMFQAFLEHRQSFVQRHARLQQMAELLGKNEQLSVGNFKILRRWRRDSLFLTRSLRTNSDRFDANGNTSLLLDLSNGNRSIGDTQHALDQAALRIPCAIRKLWHRSNLTRGTYSAVIRSSTSHP